MTWSQGRREAAAAEGAEEGVEGVEEDGVAGAVRRISCERMREAQPTRRLRSLPGPRRALQGSNRR